VGGKQGFGQEYVQLYLYQNGREIHEAQQEPELGSDAEKQQLL
jgi:hypothetical protein